MSIKYTEFCELIVHCPICGNAANEISGQDVSITPCQHLVFAYIPNIDAFEFQSQSFEERFSQIELADESDCDVSDWNAFVIALKDGKYGKDMQIFEVEYNSDGCACGPMSSTTVIFAFDEKSNCLDSDGAGVHDKTGDDNKLAKLKEAIHHKPDDPQAHLKLGDAYGELTKHKYAIAQYKEAIRLSPDNAEAHRKLGDIYDKIIMNEKAIEEYKEVVRINPGDADAHCRLGCFYEKIEMREEAIAEYRNAVRINPSHTDALSCLKSLEVVMRQLKNMGEI